MFKNKNFIMSFTTIFFSFYLCIAHAQEKNIPLGFEGGSNPMDWGELVQFLRLDLHLCREGTSQSPINIDLNSENNESVLGGNKLDSRYFSTPIRIINNGHTIHLNYKSGSNVNWKNKTFDLIQFHFHSPSEHAINGKHYDMEMHLVHKTKENNFLVVGIFIKEGKNNPDIEKIWNLIPLKKNQEKIYENDLINIQNLLPSINNYLHYKGSLTTPPCLEDVNWFIMETPIEFSKKQILKFQNLIEHNARPIQDINDRVIWVSREKRLLE